MTVAELITALQELGEHHLESNVDLVKDNHFINDLFLDVSLVGVRVYNDATIELFA